MKTSSKKPDDLPRVFRGGCWNSNRVAAWVRAADRSWDAPSDRYGDVGFRCALRGREPRMAVSKGET